jgi:TolA-binding protein
MAIPWFQIVKLVPEVVSLSKQLLQQSKTARNTGGKTQDQRIVELEANERKQAELVASMAQQIAAMAEAITSLRRQLLLLRTISTVSLFVAILAIVLSAI